jgi:hypothetical protein
MTQKDILVINITIPTRNFELKSNMNTGFNVLGYPSSLLAMISGGIEAGTEEYKLDCRVL